MPSQLALVIFLAFIVWLYVRDRHLRPMTSKALWIPLIWFVLIGTRPLSLWFGGQMAALADDHVDFEEGSSFDRNAFFAVVFLGFAALTKRKVNWAEFFSNNRILVAFFVYCGISVLWSDYPFVGFKRWIKDITNIVMLLILFSEKDPIRAIAAVWARYIYIVIPVSVLFIKYFPDLGRVYNRWTYEPSFVGVTTEKNTLGAVVLVSGMVLVWDLIESRRKGNPTDRLDLINRCILLVMTLWLLHMANSSTALVCFVLGICIIVAMRFPFAMRQARNLGWYCLACVLSGLLLYLNSGLFEGFLDLLGEDSTLTGRTDVWELVLNQPINSLLGTGGYRSFWVSEFADSIKERYYFYLNQSHNGYIETYLNEGLIGLGLLVGSIVMSVIAIRKGLIQGSNYAGLRFAFLVVALFNNWTEASFNTLSPIWAMFLIATVSYPVATPVAVKSKLFPVLVNPKFSKKTSAA